MKTIVSNYVHSAFLWTLHILHLKAKLRYVVQPYLFATYFNYTSISSSFHLLLFSEIRNEGNETGIFICLLLASIRRSHHVVSFGKCRLPSYTPVKSSCNYSHLLVLKENDRGSLDNGRGGNGV